MGGGMENPPPQAVASLVSDLKMLSAYETACDWQEPGAADKAFNRFSWHDHYVAEGVQNFHSATGEQKARVDYAFNCLVPKPAEKTDVRQAMMHQWLKARLFSYDDKYPFNFNMYNR